MEIVHRGGKFNAEGSEDLTQVTAVKLTEPSRTAEITKCVVNVECFQTLTTHCKDNNYIDSQ